ncbi:hypothetical protein ALC53_04255 [Atta colombica]|uniref:Uncharacterized protein n=1 Tax=Atta colombica TaxID=520822 RepID=A0A151I4M3_9HYME|nr:hypothetical protein ALC53_04255 [Atta colombica]
MEWPIGKGLGSSASFAVCLAVCFWHWSLLQKETDLYEFGKILDGGVINTLKSFSNLPGMKILLIFSNVSQKTKIELLSKKSIKFEFNIQVNQGLLKTLGMSHPNSDIICAIDQNFLFDEKITSEDDFILLLDNTDENIQGLTFSSFPIEVVRRQFIEKIKFSSVRLHMKILLRIFLLHFCNKNYDHIPNRSELFKRVKKLYYVKLYLLKGKVRYRFNSNDLVHITEYGYVCEEIIYNSSNAINIIISAYSIIKVFKEETLMSNIFSDVLSLKILFILINMNQGLLKALDTLHPIQNLIKIFESRNFSAKIANLNCSEIRVE